MLNIALNVIYYIVLGGHGGKIVQIVARVAQLLPKGGIVVMIRVPTVSVPLIARVARV